MLDANKIRRLAINGGVAPSADFLKSKQVADRIAGAIREKLVQDGYKRHVVQSLVVVSESLLHPPTFKVEVRLPGVRLAGSDDVEMEYALQLLREVVDLKRDLVTSWSRSR